MDHANVEQAERAAERALAAFSAGDPDTAVRLFEKSLRLHENARVRAQLNRLLSKMAGGSDGSPGPAASPAASPSSPSPSGSDPRPRHGRSPARSSAGHAPTGPEWFSGSGQSTTGAAPTARQPAPARSATATSSAAPSSSASGSSTAGLRQRATAAGSSSSSASAAAHAPPQRPFTPEQAKLVETIRKAATYYDVLGVARDADTDAIQKAFKKCALKCHPDKNPAPGAEGGSRINNFVGSDTHKACGHERAFRFRSSVAVCLLSCLLLPLFRWPCTKSETSGSLH